MSTSLDCPSPSPNLQLPHPPSPSSSEVSVPSSNSDQPSDAAQDPELPSKHSQGSPSHNNHTPAKLERMTSTGPDALKKTVKDLQRSSVSLPRFQLLLEEVNCCFGNAEFNVSHLLKPVMNLSSLLLDMMQKRSDISVHAWSYNHSVDFDSASTCIN